MRSGELRERVQFERRGAAENVGGVVKAGWALFAGPCWARIRPTGGREEELAARLGGRELFNVSVRGSALVRQVTSDDRMVGLRGVTGTFNIIAIRNPDENGREYIFTVERGGSDG